MPHRTLYVRSRIGKARTWREVLIVCMNCRSPGHITRSVYKAVKYTNEEKFDAILREAAAGLDFETLHKRLAETGRQYTDNSLMDALNYLKQHSFIGEDEKDYTAEVVAGISGRGGLKNLGQCSACGKANSVISLYSSYQHKLVAVGALCIKCGHIDIGGLPDEGQ
ncbi:MAG: hypothetical protein JRN68_03200 [Nitrososphaerota archaeon]|nr:hypothetical protein [Ferrimicrobium acidiphilum]MDG6933684.1 hypothetical protein [Nitrososphaerota archaeon]